MSARSGLVGKNPPGPIWPHLGQIFPWDGKIHKHSASLACFRPPQRKCLKLHEMGQDVFFPTNPDLADVLGDTDLDFDNFDVFYVLDSKIIDFQVPGFPNSYPG